MCCKSFWKRVVPFFAAIVIGLFITSLFITVAAPSFNFKKRGWKKHQEYHRKMERENYRLKLENSRLEREINRLESQKNVGELNLLLDVPPVEPLAPVPPARMR
jgi:hypothetical protein